VAGVWIGNDDGSVMRKVTGGTLPAQLWHDIMLTAHQDKQPLPLPGTRAPRRLQDTIAARIPWTTPAAKQREASQDLPLYQRVLGIFGGG